MDSGTNVTKDDIIVVICSSPLQSSHGLWFQCLSRYFINSITSSGAQGGRRAAAAHAAQRMLSTQTLEMLSDMRAQFGAMLADSRFIAPPGRKSARGDGRWLDDPAAPWNRQAGCAVLVRSPAFLRIEMLLKIKMQSLYWANSLSESHELSNLWYPVATAVDINFHFGDR